MSILTYPLGFIGGGKEFYNGVIENSLRYDDASNSYLSRTQVASDRTTWTHSSWVKFNPYSETSDTFAFFGAGADNTAQMYAATTSSDGLQFRYEVGNSVTFDFIENNDLFRDPNAWYHFVFVWDSKQAAGDDRVRAYVNGKRINFSTEQTAGTQGTEGWINDTTYPFLLGGFRNDGLGNNHGYQTDIYFVDGYALAPENFGEYKEGVWIPKAYAGPPPLAVDSSPNNHELQVSGAVELDYDHRYIGESSIHYPDTGNARHFIAPNQILLKNKDATIDFWVYSTLSLANLSVTGQRWNASPEYMGLYFMAHTGAGWRWYLNNSGTGNAQLTSATGTYNQNQWQHVTLTKQNIGDDKDFFSFYLDGVLLGTATETNFDTRFEGSGYSGETAYDWGIGGDQIDGDRLFDGYIDEYRIFRGVKPPRFYFGTTYGDESGGVIPQRATSAHRFTDDERTVLLVSGQSANNHARAVSLVDESGFHTDNVHFSNSTFTAYPTQDGVGHQFTMSGPQNTTRESFVGNTSSIVFDTKDDRVEVTGPTVDGLPFAIDMWLKPGELAADWNEIIGFNTSTGTSASYLNYQGGVTPDYVELYTGSSGTQRSWYLEGFDAQNWHHIALVRNSTTETDIDFYLDGHKAAVKGTEGSYSGNITGTHFEFGQREMTRSMQYYDEVRVVQSADKPQIKWTHTQTAGAGNKDAYDVHGWRAHGHEFTDDNATSLLVHGDTCSSTAGYFDLRTNDTTSSYWTVTAGADLARSTSEQFTMGMWIRTDNTRQYMMVTEGGGYSDNNRFVLNNDSSGHKIWMNGQTLAQWGGTTSADPFMYNDWNFIAIRQSGTDVKIFHLSANNGGQIGEVSSLPTASLTHGSTRGWNNGGAANTFHIGTYIDGQADKFVGDIAGWAMWHESLPDQAIVDLYNAGFTHDLGTTTGTAYTSTQTGNLKRYYSFGNATRNGVDTGHQIFNQATSTTINGGPSADNIANTHMTGIRIVPTFKDSSSANSIHHALVSGGGSHHTKAATLKSDGTNGTSTVDHSGNTIFWLGSNSTVTFANSSSFDYGNTAIFFKGAVGNELSLSTSPDWTIGSSSFTLDVWIKVPVHGSAGREIVGAFDGTGSPYEGWLVSVGFSSPGVVDFWNASSSANEQKNGTIRVDDNAWHFVSVVKTGTKLEIFIDGVIDITGTLSHTGGNSGATIKIGEDTNPSPSRPFEGYMDELRIIIGEATPPRFYLGNQAPVSDATFNEFKYVDFDGSADYYSIPSTDTGYNAFDFNGTAKFTVAAWVWNDASSGVQHMFGNADASSPNHGWRFGMENGRFYSTMKGASAGLDSFGVMATSGWQLAHALFDPAGASITHYRNGVEGTEANSSNVTGDPSYSANMAPSIGGRDGTATQLFNGRMAQICVWNRHLTEAEIQGQFDLGLTGNWKTTYSSGMVGYYNFSIADGTDTPSTSDFYDLSGNDYDMTGTSIAAVLTNYTPSNTSKRLTYQPLAYTSNVQANTAVTGNTHYGNVKPNEVNNSNFGAFVDDEYTVLLIRGGLGNQADDFFDGNTAAGATITFPAHSHSFGKTRQAKEISTTRAYHATSTNYGLHGSSIQFDDNDAYLSIQDHEDLHFDGSFCIELFWRSYTGTGDKMLLEKGYYSDNRSYSYMLRLHASNGFEFYPTGQYSSGYTIPSDSQMSYLPGDWSTIDGDGSWHHIAVQCEKHASGHRTLTMFHDGVAVVRKDDVTTIKVFGDNPSELRIGSASHNSGEDMAGTMDEIRLTKGIVRYSADAKSVSGIVPSTATGAGSTGSSIPTSPYLRPTPFVATDGGRGYFSNTNVKLWVKSDTYPGDTNFIDSAGTIGNTPKVITNDGHTAANRPLIKSANSVTDYALSGGTDGILFDNTDHIIIPNHEGLQLGISDFTIEFWIRAGSATSGIMGTCNSGAGRKGFRFFSSSSATVMNFYASTTDDSNEFTITSPAVMTADNWHHVVQQRIDDEFNMIIDGVSAVRGSSSIHIPDNGEIYIGGTGSTADSELVGYLDEIRFSKMARYTAQGLIDSDFPNPHTEFGIQTEGSSYGRFDTQVTANTTYQRYNYQHRHWLSTDFNGTSQYAKKDIDDWQVSDDRGTVVVWFNPKSVHNGTLFCTSKNGTDNFFALTVHDSQTMKMQTDLTSSSYITGATGTKYTVGDWNCFVLVGDGTSHRLFHNGSETTNTTTGGAPASSWLNQTTDRQNITIGTLFRSGAGTYFNGRISQVAYYGGTSGTDGVLTASQINDIYILGPDADLRTANSAAYSSNLLGYWTFGNKTDEGTDTASTLYDQSSGSDDDMSFVGSPPAPNSDVQLLIHSNTDIDGDTSIVDSSESEHTIRRASIGGAVNDPNYANSGANRSSLVGATYNGIYFNGNVDNDRLSFGSKDPDTGNLHKSEDHTFALWYRPTNLSDNRGIIHMGSSDADYTVLRTSGTTDFVVSDDSTAIFSGNHGMSVDTWYHLAVTRSGTTVTVYKDGTALSGTGTGTSALATEDGELSLNWFNQSPYHGYAYYDQFMFIRGSALTTAQLGHLTGGGNANTHFGALGGLIAHEEYANNTTVANTKTVALLHSNNATHHSQGSRKFYNDIVNTAFYGAGTFSATPAAAPKGHEAAGYFVVTAESGQYKFQGNTHSSTIDQNPQLRLRRGYSYIFDFSDGTNSGHQFYFANSTANSTGYAYGSGGTSGARPNAHLTGLFGTNTDPNGAPAVTWTQLTATNYGDNSGTGDAYKYIKYEVPTDAPKNLYYRCSPHSTMGNAVFVMEATEPTPVKVHGLPSLKTSGFNDRDWGGIGNSVIRFAGASTGSINQGIFVDGDGTDLYWPSGTAFAFECWFNSPIITTESAVNWFSTENFFPAGTTCLQIRGTLANGIQVQQTTGSSQIYEIYFKSSDTAANNHINQIFTDNKWHHLVVQRDGTNTWSAYADAKPLTGHNESGTKAQNINVDGQGIYIGGHSGTSGNKTFEGFMQDVMVYKGASLDANTITQNYMTGRAGSFRTANSAVAVHIKSDAPYGSKTFTDASPNALTTSTITANSSFDIYHHIEDDRTANTALYFDGASYIKMTNVSEVAHGTNPFTYECWFKPTEAYASGQGVLFDSRSANPGAGYYVYIITQDLKWYDNTTARTIQDNMDMHVWHHFAITNFNTDGGKARAFLDGVCKLEVTSSVTSYSNNVISIGRDNPNATHYFDGWMDGIRITNGMPRYTSGVPTDGQSPAKDYDDGRSSNVSSNTWATSSTRRYYGINTHTYLQTTQYSTDANTVLMIRGDDAETANDGVNMYGENGFHLEFKEVGAGDERDYNNFDTGVNGLGSDTSATQEFADDATVFLMRSRPNQANGSVQFINEVDQDSGQTTSDTIYHSEAKTIFSVDANTANVSVASGGSGTY